MKFEDANVSDVSQISALQPEGWGEIRAIIQFYLSSPFCRVLKASIDNKIVGIGAQRKEKNEAAILGR